MWKNFKITYNPDGDFIEDLNFDLEQYFDNRETANNSKNKSLFARSITCGGNCCVAHLCTITGMSKTQ